MSDESRRYKKRIYPSSKEHGVPKSTKYSRKRAPEGSSLLPQTCDESNKQMKELPTTSVEDTSHRNEELDVHNIGKLL